MLAQSLSPVWLFVTPWAVARQAPLSMGFPRQQYWSGLPFPSPGDLPDPGIKPGYPALAGRFFTSEPLGNRKLTLRSEFPFRICADTRGQQPSINDILSLHSLIVICDLTEPQNIRWGSDLTNDLICCLSRGKRWDLKRTRDLAGLTFTGSQDWTLDAGSWSVALSVGTLHGPRSYVGACGCLC